MPVEKRRFARVLFSAPARLKLPGRSCDCRVVDLSFKGALLEIDGPGQVARGEIAELILPLDKSSQIRLCGAVAHAEAARIGLTVSDLDLDSLTHLRRLIELNSLDGARFERDLAALIADAASPRS